MTERLKLGGVARVDVQRQQAELAQTQALIPGLSQQIDVTRHQLAVYIGQTPASAQLPEFGLADLTLPETLPVSLPAELARRRPDIRAAEALLHQASADIGVATANLYPQITLTASGGTQEMRARDLFSSMNVWSLAAGVVQPVFHGGELRARKRAKEAAYEQSLGAYQQAVLQGLQNVADTLRALDADAATLQAREDNARQTRGTLAIVTEQYRLGGVSQFTLLDAERQSRQAALDLSQATATRLADSAALMQALGGGVGHESPPAPLPQAGRAPPPRPPERSAKSSRQKPLQPPHALIQPFHVARVAPAHEAFALVAEGAAGGQAEVGFPHQLLAQREAVRGAGQLEEHVHRAFWRVGVHARQGRQRAHQMIARAAQALHQILREGLAFGHRRHAGLLHERRRAGGVVFHQLAEVVHQRRRQHHPAEPPAGHQPRLGERIDGDHAGVTRGDVEEGRRDAPFRAVVEPLVDLVGDDPDAVPLAVVEHGLLGGARHRPSPWDCSAR